MRMFAFRCPRDITRCSLFDSCDSGVDSLPIFQLSQVPVPRVCGIHRKWIYVVAKFNCLTSRRYRITDMQFPLDFQVTRVENGMGVEETSIITSVQLQEYGMYTLNYTDASVPVAMCMCRVISADAAHYRQEGSRLLHSLILYDSTYLCILVFRCDGREYSQGKERRSLQSCGQPHQRAPHRK